MRRAASLLILSYVAVWAQANSVQMTDVPGLSDALNGRPVKGSGFAPGRAAVINSAGQVDARRSDHPTVHQFTQERHPGLS